METTILKAAKIANAIAYFIFKTALILFSIALLVGAILTLSILADMSIRFEESQTEELLKIVPEPDSAKPLNNTM